MKHVKEEKQESIFIRHRHGTRLYINPNIKDKIKELLAVLETNPDYKKMFKNEIKDISDGSGWGIHPESTWYCCVKEIFDNYDHFDAMDEPTRILIIDLLKIISAPSKPADVWTEKLRPFLTKNIEILSRWSNVSRYRGYYTRYERQVHNQIQERATRYCKQNGNSQESRRKLLFWRY
jgi:hypothetical protein